MNSTNTRNEPEICAYFHGSKLKCRERRLGSTLAAFAGVIQGGIDELNTTVIGGLLAVIFGIVPNPASAPDGLLGSLAQLYAEEPRRLGHCELPHELEGLLGDEDEVTQPVVEMLAEYRARRAQIFGDTTPPEGTVRIAGEFEPAHTLIMAYVGFDVYDDIFADIIEETTSQGGDGVRILVAPDQAPLFSALLKRRHIDRASLSVIDDVPYDSVWIRDYGPQPVITDSGLAFVGGRYFLNCVRDDAVSTRLAMRLGGTPIYRTGLWTEGGNLLSNGEGLCVTTTYFLAQNRGVEADLSTVLQTFYGCRETVFLQALDGNAVPHVDMFMAFAAPDVILLGEFRPAQDRVNYGILEENANRLASLRTPDGRPYTIRRVPMPDPVEAVVGDPEGPVVRSYLNFLVYNDVVLVPVYEESADEEARALAIIQQAFPERFILPITADGLAIDGGSIHCITRTLPIDIRLGT